MIELQKPDKLRLFHVSEDGEKDLRSAVQDHWSPGLESKEAEELAAGACREYRLLDAPWTSSRSGQKSRLRGATNPKGQMVSAQLLASKILLALNGRGLNLYARVCLRRGEQAQSTLLMFRQSNVAYTQALTIQPTGLNRLAVIGAGEEDLDAIRKCLKTRWPYPTTKDGKVYEKEPTPAAEEENAANGQHENGEKEEEKKDGEKEGENEEKKDGENDGQEEKKEEEAAKEGEEPERDVKNEEDEKDENGRKMVTEDGVTWWQFKVKRYPWAVSYGNKHLDRVMEAVKAAASLRPELDGRVVREPNNMDAESAKSMLAFLLKVRLLVTAVRTQ